MLSGTHNLHPAHNELTLWFKNINNNRLHTFFRFDIKDFYRSIKETLLDEAMQFAKEHVPVARKDVGVIFQTRKSVLYNDGEPWVKKEGGRFDITIGAYDGAEVCELIDIHILDLIGKKYDSKNIELYRDDGLVVFKNECGPASEKNKKTVNLCLSKKACK